MRTLTAEVTVILESDFSGYPLAFLLEGYGESKEYFFSLSEDTQKALLNQARYSGEDLHDVVERFKMKE